MACSGSHTQQVQSQDSSPQPTPDCLLHLPGMAWSELAELFDGLKHKTFPEMVSWFKGLKRIKNMSCQQEERLCAWTGDGESRDIETDIY